MTDIGAAKSGLMNIGEEAKPPYAVLPDPRTLFQTRARRFATLAKGHELAGYLSFLATLANVQHEIIADLPSAALPPQDEIALKLAHGMPPLTSAILVGSEADATLTAFLAHAAKCITQPNALAAIDALKIAAPELRAALMADVVGANASASDIAQRTLVAAALQVHASRLASGLVADDIKPISDAVCPCCGSPPTASAVVGWPNAHNTRYCLCSLCGTRWNVVRIKCVLCSETGGITYHTIDGQSDAVKAESCDKCKRYVKIAYQVHHHELEEVADDVATLGLDILMREAGWRRGGHNPFLEGY